MKTPKDSYTNIDVEYELTDLPLTALGGLPVIIEAAKALGIDRLFDKHLRIKLRDRGYSEYELAMAVILTLLAGGESLEDADKIRMDEVVERGHFPHSTTIGDFLRRFTDEEQFEALQRVQDELNRQILKQMEYDQLTLDIDATIIAAEGEKREGTGKAYTGQIGMQPLVLFAAEPGMVLGQDFRAANVHPGAGAVELLKKALDVIPSGVRLHLRSDSAIYNKEVVQFWDGKGHTFTISADLTAPLLAQIAGLPEEAWHLLANGEAVAQVYYRPTGWPKAYRFIVVRKPKSQDMFGAVFRYRALVTNLERGNPKWILKRHRRHANVENGIEELKSGFSLSVMPCLAFRANRAWFQLGVIANNLFSALKLLLLPMKWAAHRIKTVRWRLLHSGGVLVRHLRRRVLKIPRHHPWCGDLARLRGSVRAFA
ncbi:MAG: IS1380 family transposase [Chloroflexi bacterium]|nr:MAG: IS1380 family transposase [Chloroflexota bacterium]